jgi:carnitine 3-dehydrogenase
VADVNGRVRLRVALLGGGVIGGGWAARFLLRGSDVTLYDPDPDAGAAVEVMLQNARRAAARLSLAPAGREGELTIAGTVEDAVAGADLVQESAPEREPMKRELLAEADRAAPPGAIITSSTSGLLPSRISAGMRNPQRFCVAHPFNPVYLLPLVELCGGEHTSIETIARAAELFSAVGMSPLHVRTEIDGFIADRLMEAMWREAVWLVHDDVATAAEIDEAIRLGPGLRWAFMGPFMTYRIAGGEDGMRHFMEQFGPSLKWPWTKLMDVPELTDELLDKIVAQSESQSPGVPTTELERIRDDCLVDVMLALRTHGVGAGEVLARADGALIDRAHAREMADGDELSQPLGLHSARVRPEWIDYNGHAHESRYLQMFGDASDALLAYVGIDAAYRATTGSYVTVETHLCHLREVVAGQRLEVTTQVLGCDEKRLHIYHHMFDAAGGHEVATAEHMYLHVDAASGRAGLAGREVLARIRRIAAAQAALPEPHGARRSIGLASSGA